MILLTGEAGAIPARARRREMRSISVLTAVPQLRETVPLGFPEKAEWESIESEYPAAGPFLICVDPNSRKGTIFLRRIQ